MCERRVHTCARRSAARETNRNDLTQSQKNRRSQERSNTDAAYVSGDAADHGPGYCLTRVTVRPDVRCPAGRRLIEPQSSYWIDDCRTSRWQRRDGPRGHGEQRVATSSVGVETPAPPMSRVRRTRYPSIARRRPNQRAGHRRTRSCRIRCPRNPLLEFSCRRGSCWRYCSSLCLVDDLRRDG
jgi:hypothetical protein